MEVLILSRPASKRSRANSVDRPGATEEEINHACLKALRCPDPFRVKNQLKSSKDALLRASFEWVVHDAAYLRWRDDSQVGLLWIKGGAGKGKTMMSIGLVEELETLSRASPNVVIVIYFFCQNADVSLNTIDAILKGLILQLVRKRVHLIKELRSQWDPEQVQFTCSVDSWEELWHIFLAMLDRCEHEKVLIIVDALDECQESIEPLLECIVSQGLDRPSHVKWLLTSRPLDAAEQILLARPNQVLVSLEMNLDRIAHGVATYVSTKVVELSRRWRRCHPEMCRQIEQELVRKAEGTFLWVSLVCKKLQRTSVENALSTIAEVPTGLPAIYERAYRDLCRGDSIDITGCTQLLRVMMLAFRPLTLAEACSILKLQADDQDIIFWIDRCASFIQTEGRGARNLTFTHQSARDFLAGHGDYMSENPNMVIGHQNMTTHSLTYLSEQFTSSRSRSSSWATTNEQSAGNRPELTTGLGYAAAYWTQHLEAIPDEARMEDFLRDNGPVHAFFKRHFLEWLECLSLIGQFSGAVLGLETLISMITRVVELHKGICLLGFVQDAYRFVKHYYPTIEKWPSQVYSLVWIFSPKSSIVRRNSAGQIPKWLRHVSGLELDWPILRQRLEGHSDGVISAVFSPLRQLLATGSGDTMVRVWSVHTRQVQQTLKGHVNRVTSVVFSPDEQLLASGDSNGTVIVWSAQTGQIQQTLKGHSGCIRSVAFSLDAQLLTSSSDDKTVKVWSVQTGQVQQTLKGHLGGVKSVAFSPDGQLLASGSFDKTIKVWSVQLGQVQQTLEGHLGGVRSIAFSPDGQLLASASHDKTIKLWSMQTGQVQQTLTGHSKWVVSVAFSPDGQLVASGSYDNTVKLWSATGQIQQTLESDSGIVRSAAFSSNGQLLVSRSRNSTIEVCLVQVGQVQQSVGRHLGEVSRVAFSPNGQLLASSSFDKTIKIWSVQTEQEQQTLEGHLRRVNSVAFSPDGRLLASGSDDKTVKVWSVQTGQVRQTLRGHLDWVKSVAFSPNGQLVASGSYDSTVKVWSVQTGQIQQTLTGHSGRVNSLVFSPDGQLLASGSHDSTAKLWSVQAGQVQQTLTGHSGRVNSVTFSPDGQLLASACEDTVRLWSGSPGSPGSSSRSRSRTHQLVQSKTWRRESRIFPYPTCAREVRFTRDGCQLITDHGCVSVLSAQGTQDAVYPVVDANELVFVHEWIVYCSTRLLYIPSGVLTCFNIEDDKVVLGCTDGRIMWLTIDRTLAL